MNLPIRASMPFTPGETVLFRVDGQRVPAVVVYANARRLRLKWRDQQGQHIDVVTPKRVEKAEGMVL